MDETRRRKFHPVYLLLLVPFVALLWVPFYDSAEPSLMGIPFFYWYQMAWTLLGALCTWPVYLYEERARHKEAGK
jgi:hypothetical protein